jgi:uncharacterized repeat protein (TIGR03843 family)
VSALRPAAGPPGPPLPAAQRTPPELSADPLAPEPPDAQPDAQPVAGSFAEAFEAEFQAEPAEEEDEGEDEATTTSVEELGLPMPVLAEDVALALLSAGEVEIVGQLWVSSNNAMLGVVRADGLEAACIYKPVAGERPLADFPDGTLARREVAAFRLSRASGWRIVPPTVLRVGPFGEGMVQLWIRADPSADPVALVNDSDPRLRRIAALDAVLNNTDRKAGHLIPVDGGHVYGVDHGVTFSPVPKLRTVLWAWRGTPFADDEAAVLASLRVALEAGSGALAAELAPLLSRIEVNATRRRLDTLIATGLFPQPDPRWPAIPWPPV